MMDNLSYLSEEVLQELKSNIKNNLSRYESEGFRDLIEKSGWDNTLKSVQVDLEKLKLLDSDKTSEAEIKNSLLIWEALDGMTPSLAYEDRIWVRLTHIECIKYTRERWSLDSLNESEKITSIQTHYFANNTRALRDLNSISRLWWVAYIASQIDKSNIKEVLEVIYKSIDIRNNFTQRPAIFSRPSISSSIVRTMKKNKEWIYIRENYRAFLEVVNKYGGGILFEAMNDNDVDTFMNNCLNEAKKIQKDK